MATIRHTATGYTVQPDTGERYERETLDEAIQFCRTMGMTPVYELGVAI